VASSISSLPETRVTQKSSAERRLIAHDGASGDQTHSLITRLVSGTKLLAKIALAFSRAGITASG
jgi:hypothetical protein